MNKNLLSYGLSSIRTGEFSISSLSRLSEILDYGEIPTYTYAFARKSIDRSKRVICMSRDILSHIGQRKWPVGIILDKDIISQNSKIISIDNYNLNLNRVGIIALEHSLDKDSCEKYRIVFSGQLGANGSSTYVTKEYYEKVLLAVMDFNEKNPKIAKTKNFRMIDEYKPRSKCIVIGCKYDTPYGVDVSHLGLCLDEFKRMAQINEAEERIVTNNIKVTIKNALVGILLPEEYERVSRTHRKGNIPVQTYEEILLLYRLLKERNLLDKVIYYNKNSVNKNIIMEIERRGL